jgi:hypothetical protein
MASKDADFDAALAPWESGWSYPDWRHQSAALDRLVDPPCWRQLELRDGDPGWARISKNGAVVSGDRRSTAVTTWAGLRSAEASSQVFSTYLSEADGCAGSERLHDRVWTGGAEAVTYRIPTAVGVSGDAYLWVAHAGSGFAAAFLGTQQGPLPTDVEGRFVDRLMSGVQSPESGGPGSQPAGRN